MKQAKIAITHASGLIAEVLLQQMAESGIAADSVVLLDQEQQAGQRLGYGDSYLTVINQYEYDYEDLIAVCLLQADAELEALLQHADCYVLGHQLQQQQPLVFVSDPAQPPALPPAPALIRVAGAQLSNLLSVIQPIHAGYGIKSLQLVNVESAALYGKSAVDELAAQTVNLLNSRDIVSEIFPMQLAFNMIPTAADGDFAAQLPELLAAPGLACSAQSLVTASFYGLAQAVSLQLAAPVQLDQLENQLQQLAGVKLLDQPASPLTHCASGTDVLIIDLQQPQNDSNRLQFWILADAVRNGLIQNYQNILEILLKFHL
ncbi:MAG: Asd/ArgC dimerization domain-containing protein [Gammaproteobacteria bacterium]|nr:Asd/ArgC dimerization domain-containing protein [Gammaproteobacteria bacterium]